VLRGYARAKAKIRGPRRAAPVVPAALRAMLAALDRESAIGARDAAILLLGFATAARRSKPAALDISNIRETEEGMEVTVYRTKVHREGPVAVPYGSNPATGPVRGPCAPGTPD
jgi:integrase